MFTLSVYPIVHELKVVNDWPPLEALMATLLAPKQVVSFEELLLSQVVQQEALTRLLVEKGVFTKEEFLEVMEAVDLLGVNEELVQGTACAQIRTADGLVHPVLAPVSGRIVESNQSLTASPASIEKDPYFDGWFYRLIPSDVDYEVPQLISCSSGDLY